MKKKTPAQLKKILWELCKQFVRMRYGTKDGLYSCYTCDRAILTPSMAHTSHFIPSGACGAYLRFDERNLRITCYNCNIHLGGNGAEFYRRMVKEVGQKEVDQIFRDKQKVVKADSTFYLDKIKYYEDKLKELS